MKCYDMINRNVLWLKLFKLGINDRFLCINKDIYRKVKSYVRSCNSYSEHKYAIGLRQGEVLSPVMFSLFVEDIELHLQSKVDSGIQIDDIMLIMLLFADAMAIFAITLEELQDHLNNLRSYCNSSGLHVNTNKTKVMVFRKRDVFFSK